MVFDSYVEAHDDPKITNNMAPSTREFIATVPTKNIQGTQKAFFLSSLKFLKRRKIILLISIYRIIKKLDDWGGNQEEGSIGRA